MKFIWNVNIDIYYENKCYKYFVNCEINVIKIYIKMIKLNELIINIFL